MKITSNFQLQEFVHPLLYAKLGDRVYDWLNPLLPLVCQQLRDEYGEITINDWLWKLKEADYDSVYSWRQCYTDSGLRLPRGSIGADYSAHRGGCAADLKFVDADSRIAQRLILNNQDDYPNITRMENAEITNTWLHIEVGVRRGDIKVFNP